MCCFVLSTQHCKHVPSPPSFFVGDHTPQNNDTYLKMYWKSGGVFVLGWPLSFCSFSQRTNKSTISKCPKCFPDVFFSKTKKPHSERGVEPKFLHRFRATKGPAPEVNGWEQVFTEQSTTGNSSTGPGNYSKIAGGRLGTELPPQELGICGFPRGICVTDFVLW